MKNASLLARLQARPRVPLGWWPTPIDAIPIDVGRTILVKREDLSGWGRGGAKARTVEHLIGHLRACGYDTLITAAGYATRLAFDLVPALERYGIEPRLLLVDEPKARWIPAIGRAAALAAGARARGRRPFVLLPGASHPASVIGNACGFLEMAEQRRAAGQPLPDVVYVPAATGTTVAGLLLAEHALRSAGGPPVSIVGVQVRPGAIRHRTLALLRWTERFLRTRERVPAARIDIRTEYLQGGSGRHSPELVRLCEDVRARSGLALDPRSGGKTWAALEDAPPGGEVMYWHGGDTPFFCLPTPDRPRKVESSGRIRSVLRGARRRGLRT